MRGSILSTHITAGWLARAASWQCLRCWGTARAARKSVRCWLPLQLLTALFRPSSGARCWICRGRQSGRFQRQSGQGSGLHQADEARRLQNRGGESVSPHAINVSLILHTRGRVAVRSSPCLASPSYLRAGLHSAFYTPVTNAPLTMPRMLAVSGAGWVVRAQTSRKPDTARA